MPLPMVFPAYNIICLNYFGQTLGKKAVGIQVITASGTTVSFRHAIVRHSVDVVLALMMLLTLLAGLFIYSPTGISQSSEISSFQRQLPAWDFLTTCGISGSGTN